VAIKNGPAKGSHHHPGAKMDASVNNAVDASLAMQQMQFAQQKDVLLLKKVLNSQADVMATLMQSVPQLAADGTLGTKVNTYA